MPNFTRINLIGSVCVHTCQRDSDRSMAGPRQIASQRVRVGLSRFTVTCSTLPECFRSSRQGAQRIARTLSVFEERSGSLVPSLKGRKARVWVSKSSSKTFQAPSFHLRLRLMMALTPKRLFLYLCISISLLRPYTLFSRSPLVNKTLFFHLRRRVFARETLRLS